MEENDKIQTGITAFAPFPAPTYRYVISSEADKLKILLEDRNSKKQWYTGDLEKSDFLTGTNKIPNATTADYVCYGALDYFMGSANDLDDSDKDSSRSEEDDDNSDEESEEKSQDEDDGQDSSHEQIASNVDPKKIRRQLVVLEDGALQLELSVKLRVLDSAWATKYVFRLKPVALEPVDILESKLRDVQEELVTIKRILKENEKGLSD
ncbi:hypothetical protein F442_09710 [Phytophthora nicotianae P10297]|uniref:Uncharacterized protein n=2 Tax=Phytophthora nicotianae TaxID=4792 RepID=W2Z9F5_PHYNI|nr:hypothetical protein L917_09446 [Phytophthora nicotianae]ETP43601.1 hypothetical protein F442_09710 [Phytophthora nicotianae P10297]